MMIVGLNDIIGHIIPKDNWQLRGPVDETKKGTASQFKYLILFWLMNHLVLVCNGHDLTMDSV